MRKVSTVTVARSDAVALITLRVTRIPASADVRQDGPETSAINVRTHLATNYINVNVNVNKCK